MTATQISCCSLVFSLGDVEVGEEGEEGEFLSTFKQWQGKVQFVLYCCNSPVKVLYGVYINVHIIIYDEKSGFRPCKKAGIE